MDDVDLADLIARAKTGDEAAICALLGRFDGDVRTMVRARLPRVLRSQFDSVDFVQVVWQSFFTGPERNLVRFENVHHLRSFLAGVVRNKVLEEHRRRTRTRKYDLNREEPLYIRRGNREVPRELAARDPSPSQDVQALDRLAQLLEGRTPLEAQVIELRHRGLTFDEIADQTGLGERSVRRIIDAARARMEARQWQ
jgi:RNA polymerase sigma factor (sigma-70 family)